MKTAIVIHCMLLPAAFDLSAANAILYNGPFDDSIDRLVYDQIGNPLKGNNWLVQVFEVGGAESLTPLVDATTRFSSSLEFPPGRWLQRSITLPVSPGETIPLTIGVWDSNKSATLFEAQSRGELWGLSAPFEYTVPSAEFPPPSEFLFAGLRSFSLVPEPSSMALAALGGVGLLGWHYLNRHRR